MKKILTLIMLALASSGIRAQEENTGYSYVNQGINIMLEGECSANEGVGYGGVAFTIGNQVNPNFFIGGGTKMLSFPNIRASGTCRTVAITRSSVCACRTFA